MYDLIGFAPQLVANILSNTSDSSYFQVDSNEYFLICDSNRSSGSFVIKVINSDELSLGLADLDDFDEKRHDLLDILLDDKLNITPGDKLDLAKYTVNASLLEDVSQNDPDIILNIISIFEKTTEQDKNDILKLIQNLKTAYSIETIISTLKHLKQKDIDNLVDDVNPIGYFYNNLDDAKKMADDYSDNNTLPE